MEKSGLTRSISDVLNTVFSHYNYSNLDEYNAILKEYNVRADVGQEGSTLRKREWAPLSCAGRRRQEYRCSFEGKLFMVKPTLKRLEQKFAENLPLREPLRERLHTAIEWALAGRAPNWPGFVQRLEKDGIAALVDNQNAEQGRLFFVDHAGKAAFAADSVSPEYNLQALHSRCAQEEQINQQHEQILKLRI